MLPAFYWSRVKMKKTTSQCARRFARQLAVAGFEILNVVLLNQILVSFGDAEKKRKVIAGVQEEGTCWAGGAKWHGRDAMRISVSSWATEESEVGRSVAAFMRVANEIG